MRWFTLCSVFVFLVACSDTAEKKPGNNANNLNNLNNQNNANNLNNSNNQNNSNNLVCEGSSPECVPSCGGDFFGGSICVSGEWQCEEEGWMFIDDCPSGSCFGLPYPGEVCDNGFKCRPSETGALAQCDETMCVTCDGFDPVAESSSDCSCICAGEDVVNCFSCEVTSTSTLPGVSIEITSPCHFLLSDIQNDPADLTYEITVEQSAVAIVVTPEPQDAGGCGQPNASGLITFETIRNGDDQYCICDSGLCAPMNQPVELVAGTYPISFPFAGLNWNGPSDTGNPMGDLFLTGEATYVVSAIGRDSDDQPFEIRSEMVIRLR